MKGTCKGTYFIGRVFLKRHMTNFFTSLRSSRWGYSIKKVFLKIFAIPKENLRWSLFLACSFIKTRPHNSFPVNFEKLLRTSFWHNTSGWVTASETFIRIVPSFHVRIGPSFQENLLAPSKFGYLWTTVG